MAGGRPLINIREDSMPRNRADGGKLSRYFRKLNSCGTSKISAVFFVSGGRVALKKNPTAGTVDRGVVPLFRPRSDQCVYAASLS